MSKIHKFTSPFLVFSLFIIITTIFIYAYVHITGSREIMAITAAASGTCPSLLPPYPRYVFLYRGGVEREEGECSKIAEARSSSSDIESECPDVFIIGARKGGTTSLYQYLSKHPGFWGQGLDRARGVGEVHYFSFTFRERSWGEYASRFRGRGGRLSGEASVSYLTSCLAPFRLRAMCGLRPRIVVLLREPVARMVSNYAMRYRRRERSGPLAGYVRDSIRKDTDAWERVLSENNIDTDEILRNASLCLFKPARNMINEGLYSLHLRRWFQYFPKASFILWRSEAFREQSSGYLSSLTARLGLTELGDRWADEVTSVHYNQNEYNISQVLRREDKSMLEGIFQPFNNQLRMMLGNEYAWYKSDYYNT